MKKLILTAALSALIGTSLTAAHAQLRITEVSAFGSGTPAYGTDWFELTNFGSSAVNISGYTMDDNSNSFASSVPLTGITSIASGESVIFTENPATPAFLSTWFGSNPPATLQIGNYSGSGVGLGTSGDAVNIFNGTGTLLANVSFGASPTSPLATFDNTAGLNNVTISALSAVGKNGAFTAPGDTTEVGSPGVRIAAAPEPSSYAAFFTGGLALLGCVARRRRQA